MSDFFGNIKTHIANMAAFILAQIVKLEDSIINDPGLLQTAASITILCTAFIAMMGVLSALRKKYHEIIEDIKRRNGEDNRDN